MSNSSLQLQSSKALIKNQLLVKGPLHIGIFFLIVFTYQVLFAGDEIFTSIGLYFLAVVIFWLIQFAIVIPITKNAIEIDAKGIQCEKLAKYGLEGFIGWSQVESLDIKYGHRSPTILFDIYPTPDVQKDKIRLRINFIEQSDEDIRQFVKSLQQQVKLKS